MRRSRTEQDRTPQTPTQRVARSARLGVGMFVAVAALMVAGVPASAASTGGPTVTGSATGGWTRGTVETLQHAYPTTDQVYTVVNIQAASEGNPDIRPFADYADDLYCADDWHVLALALWGFEVEVFDPPSSTLETTSGTTSQFGYSAVHLDGAPVTVDRSPHQGTMQPNVKAREGRLAFLQELLGVGNFTVGNGWGFEWDMCSHRQTCRPESTP